MTDRCIGPVEIEKRFVTQNDISRMQIAVEERGRYRQGEQLLDQVSEARRALLEEARAWGADTMFVGSNGFASAFERFRLGSVSVALAEHAPCAVEVVRPDEAARRAA